MIGHLPLWVVVMVWLLQRNRMPWLSVVDCARMERLIDDLVCLMPAPRDWLEGQAALKVVRWAEKERRAIEQLRGANVVWIGLVHADRIARNGKVN